MDYELIDSHRDTGKLKRELSKLQAENIRLHHELAQLRLELLQKNSQYEMASAISVQLQNERADLAQKLFADLGLVLMPGATITKKADLK
jgi:regulator of replication initiation timing